MDNGTEKEKVAALVAVPHPLYHSLSAGSGSAHSSPTSESGQTSPFAKQQWFVSQQAKWVPAPSAEYGHAESLSRHLWFSISDFFKLLNV
jgi:hypothetical protein